MIRIAILANVQISSQIRTITQECLPLLGNPVFDTARYIKTETIGAKIIYITNQTEYAPEKYEVNPFRYLPQKLLVQKLPEAYKAFCKEIQTCKPYTEYSFGSISCDEIYYILFFCNQQKLYCQYFTCNVHKKI